MADLFSKYKGMLAHKISLSQVHTFTLSLSHFHFHTLTFKYKGVLAHKLNWNERKTGRRGADGNFLGIINVCKGRTDPFSKE